MIYRDGSSGKSLRANFNFRSFCLFRCLFFFDNFDKRSDLLNFSSEIMLDPLLTGKPLNNIGVI